jgi:hypothetical protein
MTISSLVAAVVAALLSAGVATAEPLPPEKICQQAKTLALGKLRSCLLKSQALVRGGKSDKAPACRAAFDASLVKIDQKASDAGTSCRFLDHGNGTVGDLDTGLVWEQKVAGAGCTHCVDDTYTWSELAVGYHPNGTAFGKFLNALDTETSVTGHEIRTPCFAGSCDWRLPSLDELTAILRPGLSPSLDPVFGPVKAAPYWTHTSQAQSVGTAWSVDLTQPGTPAAMSKGASAHVIAVRGGVL